MAHNIVMNHLDAKMSNRRPPQLLMNVLVQEVQAPQNNVQLVTPRNSMQTAWNVAKLCEHCKQMGNILYVVDVEDTVGKDH